jgi:cell division protein FtsL
MAIARTVRVRGESEVEKVIFSTKFLMLSLFAVFFALIYITVKVEAVKIGYEISANKNKEEETSKRNLILRAEFMKLKSPERVESIAEELGFRFPTQEDLIYIEEKTVIGERK